MTPSDVMTSARQQYNAVGDTYFPDANIYNWIYQAQMILAKRADVIEQTYQTTTVAAQQGYSYPSNTMMIKRVTVNGRKIKPISMRQDDAVSLQNSASQQQGQPAYYFIWQNTINFRPIPDTTYTLQIWSFNYPSTVSATSVLDVPAEYHMDLVDYVLYRMFSQDKNIEMAQLHKGHWEEHVKEAMSYRRRRLRADGFADTQSEDTLPTTILGAI